MTKCTQDNIVKFLQTGDLKLVPSIFIGMQEEDNVAFRVQFKNCLKLLRNLAAHEPSTIVEQLQCPDNIGNSRLIFIPVDGGAEYCVKLGISQFTAWMFNAYQIMGNAYYLVFWKKLMRILYPNSVNPTGKSFNFYESAHAGNSLESVFFDYQDYMYDTRGKLKVVSKRDPYMSEICSSNKKTFWKMAIPDMVDIALLFASGDVDMNDSRNIDCYVRLFAEREVSDNVREQQ